jgi:TPR repeat protein
MSGIVACSRSQPSARTSNEQSSASADCPLFESARRDRDQRRGSPELLSRRCDRGNTQACAELGVLLLERLERGGDVRRAKRLLTRACDADEGSGCTALGTLYAKGFDAEPDFERAVSLFRRGAEAGDEHGSTLLALAQYDGLGVPRDAIAPWSCFRSRVEEITSGHARHWPSSRSRRTPELRTVPCASCVPRAMPETALRSEL